MQDSDLHLRALIASMRFQVLRKASVDGYLRVATDYARISTNVGTVKLDSKVLANKKMIRLLSERKLLTPIRSRMIAAHFLNISWNYQLEGEKEKPSSYGALLISAVWLVDGPIIWENHLFTFVACHLFLAPV